MSLDHINLRVADYIRSREFYRAALAPLGYRLAMEGSSGAGFSKGAIPAFWIKQGHVAFSGESRGTVDAFHRAALAAGGRDNGPPGIRAEYHANYYGGFVLDPDGYNIEAVCHKAE